MEKKYGLGKLKWFIRIGYDSGCQKDGIYHFWIIGDIFSAVIDHCSLIFMIRENYGNRQATLAQIRSTFNAGYVRRISSSSVQCSSEQKACQCILLWTPPNEPWKLSTCDVVRKVTVTTCFGCILVFRSAADSMGLSPSGVNKTLRKLLAVS